MSHSDDGDILLHEYELTDAVQSLPERWSTPTSNPVTETLRRNRLRILAIIAESRTILRTYHAEIYRNHENDRPEDCPCPTCRAKVDQWAIDHQGLIDPAGRAIQELMTTDLHPKANPEPSERELARA